MINISAKNASCSPKPPTYNSRVGIKLFAAPIENGGAWAGPREVLTISPQGKISQIPTRYTRYTMPRKTSHLVQRLIEFTPTLCRSLKLSAYGSFLLRRRRILKAFLL